MGMKTFPAAGAANQTGKNDSDNQQDDPDDKHQRSPGFIVRLTQSHHHGRQVDQNHQPEPAPALADFKQSRMVLAGIMRLL